MKQQSTRQTSGFAFVELLIGIVIVGIIVGAGLYVYSQHQDSNKQAADATSGSSSAVKATPKDGTTSSISKLAEQSVQSETSVSSSEDSQYQQTALSANSSLTNLGGAYDESSL